MYILDFWLNVDEPLRKRVFLLTGAPGVGKTTVLIKTVEALKTDGVCVGGMVSQEARENGFRVGFEIADLASGKHGWLSHIRSQDGPQMGKYRVNLCDLKEIGTKGILAAVEKCAIVAIDEIGPMELFSQEFKQAVRQALKSDKTVLAVVHAKAKDHVIEDARTREDAEIFVVDPSNRNTLPEKLRSLILSTF